MINRNRLVEEFMELITIPSPTKREGKFASVLKNKLEELGFHVMIDNAGEKADCDTGNIIGRLKGVLDSAPSILLSAHMDTVAPCENIRPIKKEETIYSDGTTVLGADDKAGIAAILEAIRHIEEEKISHGDIEVVFTIYEEGALWGSRNLDYSKLNSKMAFVLDSGGNPGTIVYKAPAKDRIKILIRGKAAHAGVAPETGVSAIQVAARAIDSMKLLRVDPETTANIGFIKGGGPTNIVCSEVEILAEARSLSDEKLRIETSHIVECINSACNQFKATPEIHVERIYSAFEIGESEEILLIAKRAAEKIGFKTQVISRGGGSDANSYNVNGIKSINLGIGMNKTHTTEEFIKIDSLVDSARYASAIIGEAALLTFSLS